MNKNMRIETNADNKDLMPWGNKTIIVGYVDEVNGAAASESWGFVPTRHELIQLVEYWERIALEDEWFWFTTGQVGSDDRRQRAFARRRVNRIWDLLGDEVEQAIDRVHKEFAKDIDPKLWDIFLHGDEAQWTAVQEETYRRIEEEDAARDPGPDSQESPTNQ
jgi:hypothetical protein